MSKYPECIIPPLPSKSIKDKLEHDGSKFVEKRKQGLLLFLSRICDHPILGQSQEFLEFLQEKRYFPDEAQSSVVVGVSGKVRGIWNKIPKFSSYIQGKVVPRVQATSEAMLDIKLE